METGGAGRIFSTLLLRARSPPLHCVAVYDPLFPLFGPCALAEKLCMGGNPHWAQCDPFSPPPAGAAYMRSLNALMLVNFHYGARGTRSYLPHLPFMISK